MKQLSEEQLETFRKLETKLKVINPWEDNKVIKIGLRNMYILNSLSEIFGISAEAGDGQPLGTLNPRYHELKNLVDNILKHRGKQEVVPLMNQLLVLGDIKEDDLVSNPPDIRVCDTKTLCVSWLSEYVR
jgi:hypothetical protein